MNRRGFISMLAGAAGAPLVAWRIPKPVHFWTGDMPRGEVIPVLYGEPPLVSIEETLRAMWSQYALIPTRAWVQTAEGVLILEAP